MSPWNESVWYSLLIGVIVKSVAVLAVAWLIAACLRRRSAATRHVVWTAACAALLALPFLSVLLPALPIPVAQTFARPAVAFHTSVALDATVSRTLPQARTDALKATPWRPNWRLSPVILYLAGAIAVYAQMLVGWVALWRFRRNAQPFAAPEFAALMAALQIRHAVDLLESPAGSMPMTFGLLHPAVFLPSDAVVWTAERRRVVLLHELAHVRRADFATQLLARTALGLNWCNPLAWIAWRELIKERERAADDLVLNAGAPAPEYAGHLLEIARGMQWSALLGSSAIAMARRSQLEGRLTAILDPTANRKSPGHAFALVVMLLAAATIVPMAAVRAQDASQAGFADLDATIRAAGAQKSPEMLDSAAQAAVSARKYDIARRLLDASLAIRSNVSGAQSREYGIGLLNLAELESKRGKSGEPRMFYEKAATVLGEQSVAARAFLRLGVYAMAENNLDRAIQYFEHAKGVDPKNPGPATMWMAVVRQQQSNVDEADSLYRTALSIEDASSPEAATNMELYADFLNRQGRTEEANGLRERAAASRKRHGAGSGSSGRSHTPNAYTMGAGGVTSPRVLSKVEPEYTDEARAAKYQGTSTLSLEIATDGSAHNIQIVSGLGLGLNDKAIEAISQWKFQPAMKDGEPVTMIATIEVNWRLM